jgi:DNA polymerase/3'-5' exonuclease PolX
MSDGIKTQLTIARQYAELLVRQIEPVCERVEIAGSIRRQKPMVGDIEIVAIPKPRGDLFGNKSYSPDIVYHAIQGDMLNPPPFEKQGQHYARFKFCGMDTDLFLTTPKKWGCIFLIRTGSADFSMRIMTRKWQGGYCPDNLSFRDGRMWSVGSTEPLDTPEEIDVFRNLGLEWIKPEDRI